MHQSVTLMEKRILPVLPDLLRQAEATLREYEKDSPEFAEHVQKPHVWINTIAEDPMEWSFVVERDDWESFGWHIEFKDRKLLGIWAGS